MAETPGSLIDKLITVSMKLWNQEDISRDNIHDDHIVAEAKRKINILNGQRNKLIHEIDCLLKSGDWEPFNQLKMYGRQKKTEY